MKTMMRLLGAALIVGVAATAALAGGFNYMFDPVNKIPYRWHLDHWPNGAVPVHTDLGGLGLMDNTMTTNWVLGAVAQWNNVSTSELQGGGRGDRRRLRPRRHHHRQRGSSLPALQRRRITVVYDFDGEIFANYLGFDPRFILGLALPEFVDDDTDEILEYTVFFNGYAQYFNDYDGRGFSGVFTHELGHCANLAHSQANGATFKQQHT
jgi:hypothetical protein